MFAKRLGTVWSYMCDHQKHLDSETYSRYCKSGIVLYKTKSNNMLSPSLSPKPIC